MKPNLSTQLEVIDEATQEVRTYLAQIGRRGGIANRGTEKARERARKAGRASAAARRAKKLAAENQHSTFSYLLCQP
jgi:hypothetical protein